MDTKDSPVEVQSPEDIEQLTIGELIKRLKSGQFFKASIYVLSLAAMLATTAYKLGSRSARPIPETSQSIPAEVPAAFANFGNPWPNANTGGEWQTFNDNKFLGRSSVRYETIADPNVRGDYALRFNFSLDRGARFMAADAYSGIFIDFNPPLGVANLSRYSGVRFRARRIETSPIGTLHYYINLANPQIANYAYHEYEFTGLLNSDQQFTLISVPFSLLQQPPWSPERGRVFDGSNVYRMSFFVKGAGGTGYMDIDDIVFFDAK